MNLSDTGDKKPNGTSEEKLHSVAEALSAAHRRIYGGETDLCRIERARVIRLIDSLCSALFPGVYEAIPQDAGSVSAYITRRLAEAEEALRTLIVEVNCSHARPEELAAQFLERLPEVRSFLQLDIQAAYEGDPAAHCFDEIMLSYPGFLAVMIYRFAHELYELGVPVIPRVMTEYAHTMTGIDINPGATIGRHFFIDHGTGVVIGETCVIGDNVKMYQGVTLGARSFDLDEHGNPIKGIKRHPDIENDVIIYAGATILGGDTRIGQGSVIGGNVWLTHSVPPYSKVYNAQPDPIIR